ncbi:hypothetical protein PABG_12435 [Paracoccidioides brasiliensis Pb03]|nr:hypothetical protein PABG_12435 [Paracoccidioides brasiliensis Pb03]
MEQRTGKRIPTTSLDENMPRLGKLDEDVSPHSMTADHSRSQAAGDFLGPRVECFMIHLEKHTATQWKTFSERGGV